MALAGAGLVVYGLLFIVQNFSGFLELGLSPEHVGASPAEIRAFSADLYNYISHLQVALSGFIISLGVTVIVLALSGIRRGHTWAIWTALLAPMIAVVIGLPLHYPYGLATSGHLGLIYLDVAILLAGIVMSWRGIRA